MPKKSARKSVKIKNKGWVKKNLPFFSKLPFSFYLIFLLILLGLAVIYVQYPQVLSGLAATNKQERCGNSNDLCCIKYEKGAKKYSCNYSDYCYKPLSGVQSEARCRKVDDKKICGGANQICCYWNNSSSPDSPPYYCNEGYTCEKTLQRNAAPSSIPNYIGNSEISGSTVKWPQNRCVKVPDPKSVPKPTPNPRQLGGQNQVCRDPSNRSRCDGGFQCVSISGRAICSSVSTKMKVYDISSNSSLGNSLRDTVVTDKKSIKVEVEHNYNNPEKILVDYKCRINDPLKQKDITTDPSFTCTYAIAGNYTVSAVIQFFEKGTHAKTTSWPDGKQIEVVSTVRGG